MPPHLTSTGAVRLIASWGRGRGAPPGCWPAGALLVDDGAGRYQLWSYTGHRDDALVVLAEMALDRRGRGEHAAFAELGGLSIRRVPDHFWIKNSDGARPDFTAFPGVIAW